MKTAIEEARQRIREIGGTVRTREALAAGIHPARSTSFEIMGNSNNSRGESIVLQTCRSSPSQIWRRSPNAFPKASFV